MMRQLMEVKREEKSVGEGVNVDGMQGRRENLQRDKEVM
jgi:hypothetical protein